MCDIATMSTTQRRNSTITRRRGACTSCRQRKIRCDGARPCVKCEKAGVSCRYRSRSERSTGDSWDTSHSQLTFSPSPESSVHNASISLFGRGLADSRSGKELYASHDSGAGSELMDVETTFNDISWLSDTTEFFGPSQDTTTSPKIKSAVQAKERRPEVCSLDSSTLGIMSSIEQYVRTRYSKSQTGVQLFSTFVRKAVSITSSVQSHKDSKTASYNRSDATVDVDTQKELLEAFFHEPAFCSSYLRCGDIDEMISLQDRQDARLNAEKRALLNAVLALGSKVTDTSTAEDPSRYFSRSLEFRLNLIGGAASVGKIKAVVTMLVFCEDSLEQETVTSLLANALSMAQTLRLYQKAAVRALCVSEDDEIALKNLVWVLFSMEGRLNLRFGRLPLLNEDFIEHRPPVQNERKSTCAEVSLFLFYKYAQLSTAINANLFSKRALEKTGADLEEAVTSMQNLLEEWGNLIPTELSPLHVPTTASSATIQTPEGRLQLNLAYRYHEAVFAVHRRLFMPPAPQSMSPSGHPETVPTRGNGIILKSARFLLSITDAKLGQRDTSLSWFVNINTSIFPIHTSAF